MTSTVILVLIAGVGVLMIILLALQWWRARRVLAQLPEEERKYAALVADARIEEGERPSSLVAEQIEEMVKASLAADPELGSVRFDLGTAPDGTLEIWIDERAYTSVKDIPDPRIRQAIEEAAEEWNRRAAG